jgi:geranylgeranyl pyrophosphate synthase
MDKRADVFAPLAQVDQRISDLLEKVLEPGSLREACIYAVVGGGKRVRPMLCWHACVAVGGHGSRTLDVGAALELIHAFSLVHDDLPALDDDDLRRGKPTLHRYAGEAMAILAGDALLSAAFGVVTDAPMIPAATRLMLVRRLAAATCSMTVSMSRAALGPPGARTAVAAARLVRRVWTRMRRFGMS